MEERFPASLQLSMPRISVDAYRTLQPAYIATDSERGVVPFFFWRTMEIDRYVPWHSREMHSITVLSLFGQWAPVSTNQWNLPEFFTIRKFQVNFWWTLLDRVIRFTDRNKRDNYCECIIHLHMYVHIFNSEFIISSMIIWYNNIVLRYFVVSSRIIVISKFQFVKTYAISTITAFTIYNKTIIVYICFIGKWRGKWA